MGLSKSVTDQDLTKVRKTKFLIDNVFERAADVFFVDAYRGMP